MGRRPALKVGNLYYIRISPPWDKKKTYEYVAQILSFEDHKDWSGPPAIWAHIEVHASTTDDVDEWKQKLHVHQIDRHPLDSGDPKYYWHKAVSITLCQRTAWIKDVVIQNFKPEILPLCLAWPYGSLWATQQLKEQHL